VTARGPAIHISVEVNEGGNVIQISAAKNNYIPITNPLYRDRLRTQRRRLNATLKEFKKLAGYRLDGEQDAAKRTSIMSWLSEKLGYGKKKDEWQDLRDAIEMLLKEGRVLAQEIFGDKLPEVIDLFQPLQSFWTDPDDEIQEFPHIAVEAQIEDIVPIEFLPLLNFGARADDIKDTRGLISVMRSFISFSTIVRRYVKFSDFKEKDSLENEPKLPVKFFQHAGLFGARKEAEFFRRHSDYIDMDGPWPDQLLKDMNAFKRDLAAYLWIPGLSFSGDEGGPVSQIHHFSCHCNTGEVDSRDCKVILSHNKIADRNVTIYDLQDERSKLLHAAREIREVTQPLVFFNACGTAAIDLASIESFPQLFLNYGSCGFIGTETLIPDRFAYAFSEEFYKSLITGKPLGEAIQIAKWRLLKRNDPLGILYTAYANPEMSVTNPVKNIG
jgi:hypothetical protein